MTLNGVFKMVTGHDCQYWAERGELDWYERYADGSDSGEGVLTANWNRFPRHPERTGTYAYISESDQAYNWSRKGMRFQDILERMGYKLEWSDQTDRCDQCNGCIQTNPHCYGDTAHYAILGECDIVCEDCIRKNFAEEYLEGLENNPRAAMHIRGIDPAQYGYELIEEGFESGHFPGQNADPQTIFEQLREQYSRLLFVIDQSGQFDVRFSVWHKLAE